MSAIANPCVASLNYSIIFIYMYHPFMFRYLSCIDLMHMTSQKGAPACWGSNEALSRAPSPSMQPGGQPLHAIPLGRPGPAHWLRAPTWRCCCYGDVTSMHKVYYPLLLWLILLIFMSLAPWQSFYCECVNCIPCLSNLCPIVCVL